MAHPDEDAPEGDAQEPLEDEEEDDAPAPVGSRYITPEGAARLRAELTELLTVERPKVTAEVSFAASLGDRSENAEYIYGKRRLREIDRRLRFLHKRLEQLTVVDPTAQKDRDRVYFGALVTLRNEDEGTTVRYQLVGSDETDLAKKRISVDSPVGRALLGKRRAETVTVTRPLGEVDFTIVAIDYG